MGLWNAPLDLKSADFSVHFGSHFVIGKQKQRCDARQCQLSVSRVFFRVERTWVTYKIINFSIDIHRFLIFLLLPILRIWLWIIVQQILVSHFGVLSLNYFDSRVAIRYDFKRLGCVKKKELFKYLNSETCLFWPVTTKFVYQVNVFEFYCLFFMKK